MYVWWILFFWTVGANGQFIENRISGGFETYAACVEKGEEYAESRPKAWVGGEPLDIYVECRAEAPLIDGTVNVGA